MAEYLDVLTAFLGGEVDSTMYGRIDLEIYRQSLRTATNIHILPQGGARRRDGTIYVAEVKTSANKTRIIPYVESVTNAYILELGNAYMRFYKTDAQLGAPTEISTPWLTADLFDIQYAQDQNSMYMCDSGFSVRKLTRTNDTTWTLAEVDFVDGPYLVQNRTATTITPSATTGAGITLTASTAIFDANDTSGTGGTGAVDRLVRILHGSTWGYAKIVGFTSTTVVTADVVEDFGGTTASANWRLGAFSTTTGFPSVVAMHEQRLILAATTTRLQDYWGSKPGYFEDFEPGTDDADGLQFTIADSQYNQIGWMASFDGDLFSGAANVILNHNGSLTPSAPEVRPVVRPGAFKRHFVRAADNLLYVSRTGKKLYEVIQGRSFTDPKYTVSELTFAHNEILTTGVEDSAYTEDPYPLAYFVRNDGTMAVLTYDPRNNVRAWQTWTTDGTFESVAVIPRADSSGIGHFDQVWVVVNRTINGATVRYVERFDPSVNTDSAVVTTGSHSSVTASHLKGESLTMKGDGAVLPNATVVVATGVVALGDTYTSSEVGMGYTFTMETQPVVTQTGQGVTLAQKRRTDEVVILVNSTLGGQIEGDPIIYRIGDDPMDAQPPAFTGAKKVKVKTAFSRDGTVTITGSQPYDFEIVAIVQHGTIQDG